MDENTFHKKLKELIAKITELPPDQQHKLLPLIEETKTRYHQMRGNFEQIKGLFDTLRINLKYLLFDLEATKRERDQLKNELEDQSSEDE